MNQGLRAYLARRHATVATAFCGSDVEGSYVCPGAARLKWTASKALALQQSPDLCLKRPRSNPDKANAEQTSRNNGGCGSYGDPVQERKAAGRLWIGRNNPGVASIPKLAAKLPRRKLL